MTDQKIGELGTTTAPNAKIWRIPVESVDGTQNARVTGDQISEGWRTIGIPAAAFTPRSANGCADLAKSNGASNQPDVPYLAFDGSAKEYAGFHFPLPESYKAASVLRARFKWRRASGTGAANVVWGVRGLSVGDSESPAQNFGSDATVTAAADTTTADFDISGWTGDITLAGTPAGGEIVFLEVFRDGASGDDTLNSVDAWLTGVELQYQVERADDRVPS